MTLTERRPHDPGLRLETSPAIGVVRTIGLLVLRRIRFHREEVGQILTTADGAEYRVFRYVTVESREPRPEALFVVRFTPARMTVRQNIRFSRLPMLVFMGFRGFRSKFWCVDDATGAREGVYEWQTRGDAESYARSVALRFMTNRSMPGSESYHILDRTGDEPWPLTLS